MESVIEPLAALIKDPILIFVFALFVILGWVVKSLLETIKEQMTYERELVAELNNNSQTLVRLTTLVETLVHGRTRGGQAND